ncbi:MAG: GLPGLI family protein [Bacteroidia bacterium]
MKKTIIFLMSLVTFGKTQAQNTEGVITYEEKIKMELNFGDGQPPPMVDSTLLPKEHKMKRFLYFTSETSMYLPDKTEPGGEDIRKEADGAEIHIKMDQPDNKTYCDLKNNKLIDQREFMTRKFLIESDINRSDWKLTGKQKMILNHNCQEATKQEGDNKISVWFTSEIPLSTGPSRFIGLPGMVLEVNINDGKQVVTATNIEFKTVDKTVFVKPKEGKKVTREEFNKIVDEKTKEMEKENGGNGNIIIKIGH